MINANIDYSEMSNTAIIGLIGEYIKQQRLDKNITQQQVAEDAGVNRWTVGKIERGDSITLVSLIQILRALDLLNAFEKFQYERKISPIEMVKLEGTKLRARGKNSTNKVKSEVVKMNTAIVKIWDMKVGAIAWDEINQIARFEYYPEFVRTKIELSPIKMPLPKGNRVFEFPELRKSKNDEFDTFKGLPGLLADSLPDRYGNQLINSWLAKNGRPANSMNPVEKLCFIGSRGMGALEFEPAQFSSSKYTSHIEMDSLVNIAQKMLNKRENFNVNLEIDDTKAMKEILKIGTSAGGARPKAIIAYNAKTGEVRSGQTKSPKGFEHWLIKLDGVSSAQFGKSTGYGRVEMAYYKMATACGIKMMKSRLLEENGRAHFMTKRFDRENGNIRHHIQTLCAMQHFDYNQVTSYSYEQLFQTMRKLRLPYNQAVQMFRRMAFNVIACNCDDHTKNFSFRLRKNSRWELSPAYDICFAFDPQSIWVSQHALSVNGKRKGITSDDLLNIAKSMNIKKSKEIINDIKSNVARWHDFADEFKVRAELKNLIYNNLVLDI